MTEEVKETTREKIARRKRRNLEEREHDAKRELETIAMIKKESAKSKIQHAIDTLETMHADYTSTPIYATTVKQLKELQAGIK